MSVLHPDNPSTSLGHPRLPSFLDGSAAGDDPNGTAFSFSLFSSPADPLSHDELAWLAAGNDSSTQTPLISWNTHKDIRHFCKQILIARFPFLDVRYWDTAILIPNLLFLLFLLVKLGQIRQKLKQSRSPVFCAFFLLVYITTFLNITRCLVSMSISATHQIGEIIDKVLWLVLKFFLLSAELCVLSFGLLFGHLDSGSSIRRALIVTLLFSLLHALLQSVLEFKFFDHHFIVNDSFNLYAHGGMTFWMMSSALFALIYSVACILPLTCCRRWGTLPRKSAKIAERGKFSFYIYCFCLALLNILQTVGAALIYVDCPDGMCIADLTSFVYFTLYTPIVYFVFLRRSISGKSTHGGGPLFSYHQQKDEGGDLQDTTVYYPRFSGLTSPSYDDLFDVDRISRNRMTYGGEYDYHPELSDPFTYSVPLMMSTPDSTVTTHVDSDQMHFDVSELSMASAEAKSASAGSSSTGTTGGHRQLRGLGTDGKLHFASDLSPDAYRSWERRHHHQHHQHP
uniref:Integral membrane protein GPR175 n=1 Tax=Steinernema glaseri TaxID=37863 RepID=A0A1I7Z1A3_9BILA